MKARILILISIQSMILSKSSHLFWPKFINLLNLCNGMWLSYLKDCPDYKNNQ